MADLVALDLPGGPGFVDALQRVWDAGDAALPIDQRLDPSERRRLVDRMGARAVVDAGGDKVTVGAGRPVETGDALVVASSGSTGTPKGVVLTHTAVAASAEATSKRLDVTPDDHWLACLPLAHVGGLSVVTRALHTGNRLTVLPGFSPEAVEASGASLVSLVHTAMLRIDTQLFRLIVLGGARPPAGRPPNTVTTYGMTETGSGVVYDRRPLDGVEVRIVDGEVQLRCPMLLRCYRDGTDPKTVDGWFATGDLGKFDGGELEVAGRRGDLIITGGENVWPEPVEDALRVHPALADVAVVGHEDPEWGHIVTAHIVVVDGQQAPELSELRDLVKQSLPAFHAPRKVVVHAELPRTLLGKIKRNELVERAG